MDLEKLREQKKKTLGPKAAFIQYVEIGTVYNWVKNNKIHHLSIN